MGRPVLLLASFLAVALGGCVKRSTHEAALAELTRIHTEQRTSLESQLAEREAEVRAREQSIAELDALLSQRGADIARMEQELAATQVELDRVESLLSRQGAQYAELQERLLQLAQVEREIRERNMIYEDVLQQFRSLIDAGRLSVEIVRGRMVIQLPQDILFASGSATLSAEGRQTIREVGQVLAGFADRSFQVEGHTDNVPISTQQFPSNWELSSARAMSVIRVLLDAGVPPANLSGAGYGEYQPRAPNDTPENRRLNRRIEIVMLPNLDVIADTRLP